MEQGYPTREQAQEMVRYDDETTPTDACGQWILAMHDAIDKANSNLWKQTELYVERMDELDKAKDLIKRMAKYLNEVRLIIGRGSTKSCTISDRFIDSRRMLDEAEAMTGK